jgi:hypothetical protein
LSAPFIGFVAAENIFTLTLFLKSFIIILSFQWVDRLVLPQFRFFGFGIVTKWRTLPQRYVPLCILQTDIGFRVYSGSGSGYLMRTGSLFYLNPWFILVCFSLGFAVSTRFFSKKLHSFLDRVLVIAVLVLWFNIVDRGFLPCLHVRLQIPWAIPIALRWNSALFSNIIHK